MYCYSEAGFEAVEGGPVVVVLVPAFAEEQGVVIEKEVSLHGFEASQLLHPHRSSLMADPHAEAALHHHTAQLTEVTLGHTDTRDSDIDLRICTSSDKDTRVTVSVCN